MPAVEETQEKVVDEVTRGREQFLSVYKEQEPA